MNEIKEGDKIKIKPYQTIISSLIYGCSDNGIAWNDDYMHKLCGNSYVVFSIWANEAVNIRDENGTSWCIDIEWIDFERELYKLPEDLFTL